jgi:hypothetical protein
LAERQLVPHFPDETTLLRLESDPNAFAGKAFILCGDVKAENPHDSNTFYSQPTHYTFRFHEHGRTWGDRKQEAVWVNLKRDRGKRIADRIIKKQEEFEARGLYLALACRIRARVLPDRDGGMSFIEILDVQFLNSSEDGWDPWMLGATAWEDGDR